jgi:hypothetical protein
MKITGTAAILAIGDRILLHGFSKSPNGWRVASGPFAALSTEVSDEELGSALRQVLMAPDEAVENPSLSNAAERRRRLEQSLGTSRAAMQRAVSVGADTDGEQVRVSTSQRAEGGEEGAHDTGRFLWASLWSTAEVGRVVRMALRQST